MSLVDLSPISGFSNFQTTSQNAEEDTPVPHEMALAHTYFSLHLFQTNSSPQRLLCALMFLDQTDAWLTPDPQTPGPAPPPPGNLPAKGFSPPADSQRPRPFCRQDICALGSHGWLECLCN